MDASVVDANALLLEIGAHVRQRREQLGLSQMKLANRAHVHCNAVGRLERGIYNPAVIVLCAIAAALNTTASKLVAPAPIRPLKSK